MFFWFDILRITDEITMFKKIMPILLTLGIPLAYLALVSLISYSDPLGWVFILIFVFFPTYRFVKHTRSWLINNHGWIVRAAICFIYLFLLGLFLRIEMDLGFIISLSAIGLAYYENNEIDAIKEQINKYRSS